MTKITFFGIGYVGLVSGVCMSEVGHDVTCFDIDRKKISNLKKGIIPILEPGLSEMAHTCTKAGRLVFTDEVALAVSSSDIFFVGVGTPSLPDGSANLEYIYDCAKMIAENVTSNNFIVVIKSTVPAGTNDQVQKIIQKIITRRNLGLDFSMCSNPEFLREGSSVSDFMNPERIIIGTNDSITKDRINYLYAPFEGKTVIINCDIKTAEIAKYASNSMLAARISFMNEIARICDVAGGDVEIVKQVLGTDSRIGPKFLNPGIGYGGSCFPKDVKELIHYAKQHKIEPVLLESIHKTNEIQKNNFIKLVLGIIADRNIKEVGILGLAFKPGTNDLRDAPAIELAKSLLAAGISVLAFDPGVKKTDLTLFQAEDITLAQNTRHVLEEKPLIIIVTEWDEFFARVESLVREDRQKVIIDGRNMFDLSLFKNSRVDYYSVGRPPIIN